MPESGVFRRWSDFPRYPSAPYQDKVLRPAPGSRGIHGRSQEGGLWDRKASLFQAFCDLPQPWTEAPGIGMLLDAGQDGETAGENDGRLLQIIP